MALQDGRLFFSAEQKKVYIRDAAGTLLDAATGQPVAGAPPADLKPVRLNNRLRRIDRCRARQPDAAVARSRASGSKPPRRCSSRRIANALPALEQAIAKETDPRSSGR